MKIPIFHTIKLFILKVSYGTHMYFNHFLGRKCFSCSFHVLFLVIVAIHGALKKFKLLFPLLLLILVLFMTNCSKQSLHELSSPTGLLCELLREPEKAVITDSIPEFSWIFPAEGKMQQAYRILVASSPHMLKERKADLWDSKSVKSSKSVDVVYGGKALESNHTYYWKVKVWGQNDTESAYSNLQVFNTGKFSGRSEEWPGQSHFIELGQNHWVSENRQTASFHQQDPVLHQFVDGSHYFADFGKAAFGTLGFEATTCLDDMVVQVYLGERKNDDLTVNKEPGLSNIGFTHVEVPLKAGRHHYLIKIPPHTIRSPHTQTLAPFYPEVLPFRFVEIASNRKNITIKNMTRQALFYPFDDEAAYFHSDNENLNKVWELCHYTLKATPFLGLYADGNRERMPYEADAYIQQLGHYAVDREFSVARYSAEFLIYHASWPTEWSMHTVFMAWEDFMHTGNTEFIERNYVALKAKTLMALAREDGLISSRSEQATSAFFQRIFYSGNKFRDNIDWPEGTPAGEKQGKNKGPTPEGERDGYVITDYNTVINAFHYKTLELMGKMAAAINQSSDQEMFEARAQLVKNSFLKTFLDTERGIFIDGEGTDHAALHANMFPLAFGLVPEENLSTVVAYIKNKGMACSVYGSQYLLDGLYNAGAADYALSLMTAEGKRSWMNMIRVGSTMTTEAWDEYYKPNLTWNHAWGSAPANIMVRKTMGIEALEPGFKKFRICPQPGYLDTLIIRKPSIRGTIEAKLIQKQNLWKLEVFVPGNTEAEIWIPDRFTSVMINSKNEEVAKRVYYGGKERNVFNLGNGTFKIIAQ